MLNEPSSVNHEGSMDIKLMRDFEELEGLTDQNVDDETEVDDNDDDDPSFRPTSVANLNNSDVYYEVYSNQVIIFVVINNC